MLKRRLAKSGPQIGDIALSLGGSEKRSLFKERDLTSAVLRYPTPPPGAGAPLVERKKARSFGSQTPLTFTAQPATALEFVQVCDAGFVPYPAEVPKKCFV